MLTISFVLFIFFITTCECANILYVVPFTSKSHFIMLKPIGLELARRGHNVTVITGNKVEEDLPNYHQVLTDGKEIWEVAGIERPNVFTMVDITAEEFHDFIFWRGGVAFTKMVLESAGIKQFLSNNHTFDLVLSEQFFQEALYTLAHKYKVPLALITTYGNCMRHNIAARNPLQLSTLISEFLDLKSPTSFLGRLRNFYFTIYEYVWWRYWYLGQQEELARKYIPGLAEPLPSLYDMQRDASLMLINSHFSFDSPVAYLPNIVEIGGVHLTRSSAKLPEDLQKLLDESKHGVVYVNFGSNVRSSELPVEKKNAFLKVFSELNQTVLWKWEEDNLENKSRNVVIRKWFPQKDVLAHPNIKVFMSHGGLIGTQEAIFYGVPIMGIPIYADQYNNLLQAQNLGFGKIQLYHDITVENLKRNILDVMNDTYKKKAEEVSARFKDRPMTPLDTAIFWLEYVIRNKGADFAKNPARKMNWFAYNMIDVYAFFFVVFVVAALVAFYGARALINLLFRPKGRKVKEN